MQKIKAKLVCGSVKEGIFETAVEEIPMQILVCKLAMPFRSIWLKCSISLFLVYSEGTFKPLFLKIIFVPEQALLAT